MTKTIRALSLCVVILGHYGLSFVQAVDFASHPPLRRLPAPSARTRVAGPAYFVDAVRGDDQFEGNEQRPWKTVAFAVKRLQPGDTLYLRGGTYYESIRITSQGAPDKPITIRSYPGELAILDAGHREFQEHPAEAWEPVTGGGPHEFRSTKSYATGGTGGNFGDSMVPLHRYLTFADLRSSNELFHPGLSNRVDDPRGMYCGPGTRRDQETGRIHVRLSPTQLAGLGDHHYRGETDPRKLPLVICGADFGLLLERARHVRFQDVVVRGAKEATVRISNSEDIEFDGVTLYAVFLAVRTDHTRGLRFVRSALRGHAAPWHSRFHHKNRAGSGYLVLTGPEDADFEFACSELTDHHDCITFRSVEGMKIHHCLIDNFNDDGIEPGPQKEQGRTLVYQNVISRVLNPFTAHGNKTEPLVTEPGSGMYVFRNIVDLRRGTYKSPPEQPDPTGAYLDEPTGLILHDHGSPTQQNYYVYHNTFLLGQKPYRNYYAFTWGAHTRGAVRRVFNNIFVQVADAPGLNITAINPADDFQADGNLYWAVQQGAETTGDLFATIRKSPLIEAGKVSYPPGWSAHDQFANPKFVVLDNPAGRSSDLRLQSGSPAIDAGVPIPSAWPDLFRDADKNSPDIGALPFGAAAIDIGPSQCFAVQKP